jgi:cbb3-type cytochrome oxidase maturation protein
MLAAHTAHLSPSEKAGGMSIIFILIPVSIVIAACFLFAFIWAVKSGQYEDTCTPSMRLLAEDVTKPPMNTLIKKEKPQHP